MARGSTFVRVYAHENLASFGELVDEVVVVSDKLLNGFVMAEVSQVTEDRHEAFRLERKGIDIDLGLRIWGEGDAFLLNLIREESRNDGEEAGNDVVMPDDV